MNIDYKKIADLTGLNFDNEQDLLIYMQHHITYLATHNKNLTNKQYHKICDLESILNSINAE